MSRFAEWVRISDDHRAARLALMERVEPILEGRRHVDDGERAVLADKLERWRYQLLDEIRRLHHCRDHGEAPGGSSGRSVRTDPSWRPLVDALDQAARKIARRPALPPRAPRAATETRSCEDPAAATAAACLDDSLRLGELESQAASRTRDLFGGPLKGSAGHDGWRILLYAPVYLSSLCINHCVYCGFSFDQEIPRRHLTVDEALSQALLLQGRGFRHLLLVAGDFPSRTSTAYFEEIIGRMVAAKIKPGLEVAALSTGEYGRLVAAGACGVTLYMETYQEATYAAAHLRGPKRSFDWRLEAMERAAEAGVKRLGLGILLGLADPYLDLMSLVRHARYLEMRFPGRKLAFSLPRIHAAPEGYTRAHPVDDDTFVRLYCALRLAFPEAELVLSTREEISLRNRLARICVTQMSAGSSTRPGGYGRPDVSATAPQFPVADLRSPAAVAAWLEGAGFQPIWDLPDL
ncbi:MAG: radical SAM protein [Acidobacteriota bacterium]